MNIDKDANLGTGNIIQEFNIFNVRQINPVATTIINHYGADGELVKSETNAAQSEPKRPADTLEIHDLREQILRYVGRLSSQVADVWKSRYEKLWQGILDLDVVAARVYDRGKQQKTNFNRNLVANIIYWLGNNVNSAYRVYTDYNAALFTEKLEADKDHPVRAELRKDPPSEIVTRLSSFMETFLL
jgi:hypothetical protein